MGYKRMPKRKPAWQSAGDLLVLGAESRDNCDAQLFFQDTLEQRELDAIRNLASRNRNAEVVARATKVINDRKKDLDLLISSSTSSGFSMINPRIVEFCELRAQAYLNLGEFEKAGADTTTCYSACVTLIKNLSPSYPDLSTIKSIQGEILEIRASALAALGDIQGLRDCVALGRNADLDLGDFPFVVHLMVAMGCSKAGAPRPHYTPEEARNWNKELGIKEYSKQSRVCSNCGAPPSQSTILKNCGRCRRVWFCGAACQRANWPTHKDCCVEGFKPLTGLPKDMRAEVLAGIAADGYYTVSDAAGPAVVLLDEGSGKLFESLSDQDVIFF